MAKRVLITGISGFMGSHLMEHVLVRTDWDIVGLASWQHKGVPERIADSLHYQAHKNRVEIITHDLNAPVPTFTRNRLGHVDYIINCAADSHVDRSISDPVPFVQNNVNLVLNMLELARAVKPQAFIQVSTDEVYGPMHGVDAHGEWSPTLPSNPYSASKAAQEAIAIAYWRTYGVPVIITNTMNLFAERQDAEKFMPSVIRNVVLGNTVIIHGTPDNIGSRFYIHARNQADALLYILNHVTPAQFPAADRPDRFNVVGEVQLNNLEVAQKIAAIVGRPLMYELEDFHSTRPGHDPHYGLNGVKLHMLGWRAPLTFDESLRRFVEWSLAHPEWLGLPAVQSLGLPVRAQTELA